jgi:hypothetical protein
MQYWRMQPPSFDKAAWVTLRPVWGKTLEILGCGCLSRPASSP